MRETALEGPSPSACRDKGLCMGRGCNDSSTLCITQQWHLASMAVWVTSVSTPGSRLPPFHPLRLSPHRQWQSSPWICSLIPTFQLPAPVLTSGHTSQSGAHRAVTWTVYVGHSLSCLPQTRHFTLFQQPQILLFCPN